MKHHWVTTDNVCHLVVAFGKLNPRRIHTFSTSPLLHDGLWKSGAILERIFLQRRTWRKGACIYSTLKPLKLTDRQSVTTLKTRISRTCDETHEPCWWLGFPSIILPIKNSRFGVHFILLGLFGWCRLSAGIHITNFWVTVFLKLHPIRSKKVQVVLLSLWANERQQVRCVNAILTTSCQVPWAKQWLDPT